MRLGACFVLALSFVLGQGLSADTLYNVTDLGTLGGTSSSGEAINNSGQVTGWSYPSSGPQHAFLYSNGHMTDLGTLGGSYTVGYGINGRGQVTGASYTPDGYDAFLYSNGQMIDLGILPAGGGMARLSVESSGSGITHSTMPFSASQDLTYKG